MDKFDVAKAREFAVHWHGNQVRKYTFEPYVVHLDAVAQACKGLFEEEYLMILGYLHDTVEDTECTLTNILDEFGIHMMKSVDTLTEDKDKNLNREQRHKLYNEKLSKGFYAEHTVKCADIINNVTSIAEHDPKFGITYCQEKIESLKILTKANKQLYSKAWETVGSSFQESLEFNEINLYNQVLKRF